MICDSSISDGGWGMACCNAMMDQGADVFFGDASAADSGARQAIDEANAAAGEVKVYDVAQPGDFLGQNECIICSQVTDNASLAARPFSTPWIMASFPLASSASWFRRMCRISTWAILRK